MPPKKSELTLQKFDMNRIKDDNIVVFIGKRNTGKSFLIRDMLWHHSDIPMGVVISGTESANGFYNKMVPEMFIHHDFTPEIVSNVMRRQMLMTDKIESGEKIDPRAFVIFDDLMFDSKEWIRDRTVKEMFFNGRHYKIFFMISMQYPLGIPPELRTNIDFIFLLREPYMSNRKRLYEHYAGMFESLDKFSQVMNQCTEDYECLVIDNTTKSNKITDQVYWYKAENHGDFKLGSQQFWDTKKNDEIRRRRKEARLKGADLVESKKGTLSVLKTG